MNVHHLHCVYNMLCISLPILLLRCFAALGDVAKARYLRETHELAKQKELETVSV